MEYKTTAKLVIQACDKDLPGVFGHGCVLLLQGIAREHSLNRAAKSMGMAYSKAWRIVNEAEGQLGCKLIERDGARGSTRRRASHSGLRGAAGRHQQRHRHQSKRPHRQHQGIVNKPRPKLASCEGRCLGWTLQPGDCRCRRRGEWYYFVCRVGPKGASLRRRRAMCETPPAKRRTALPHYAR